jgi:HK97 family phage prohead protease
MSTIICDVDGTLYMAGGKVNEQVAQFIRDQASIGEDTTIVSARNVSRLAETERWLKANDIPYGDIHLSDFPQGPNSGVAFKKYKAELLIKDGEEIDLCIDNDAAARAAYAELGLKVEDPKNVKPGYQLPNAASVSGSNEHKNPTKPKSPAGAIVSDMTPNPDSMPQAQTNAAPTTMSKRALVTVPTYVIEPAAAGVLAWESGLGRPDVQERDYEYGKMLASGQIDSEELYEVERMILKNEDMWDDIPANSDPLDPAWPGPYAVLAMLYGVDPSSEDSCDATKGWLDAMIDRTETAEEVAGGESGAVAAQPEMPARAAANEHEIRVQAIGDFTVADTADNQKTFTGYAAVFNTASEGLPFVERIAPGAFKRAIAQADQGRRVIKFLHGHDESRMLATTASGRLKLQEDAIGLRIEAKLDPADPDAAAVISKLTHEATAMGMSFGFTVPKNGQQWNEDGSRTLTDVGLLEVSTLSGHTPAYPATLGLTAVRKASKPLGVDADELIATVEAIKAGKKLNEDQTNLLDKVRAKLGAKPKSVHPSVAAQRLAIARMMQEDV